MKSRFLKVCSMVIIVALLIQLLPLQVLALETNEEETPIISTEPIPQDNPPSAEKVTPNEPATILGENTSKRTEFSKEYRLSNGLNLAVVYPDAVHYQKDGQWEDIDTTLTVKNGVYTTAASPMNVSFPQQLSNSNAVTVELNGYAVSFGMAGELRGSADGKITTSEMGRESAEMTVTQMQTSTAQLQTFDYSAEKAATEYPETVPETLKSRLVYANVYSNTNVVYDLTGYKLKESVVIARYDSELQGYSYTLDTGKLIPVLNEDNSISLIDPATKEAVLNMPAPYMIDYDGEISNDVEVMLTPNGTTYTLMYRLPAQWLAAEDRSWPVVLDPVIQATVYCSNIVDACASEEHIFPYDVGCMMTGWYEAYGAVRSYLYYRVLPELASSDVVVHASLAMERYDGTSTTDIVEVHQVLSEWNSQRIHAHARQRISHHLYR